MIVTNPIKKNIDTSRKDSRGPSRRSSTGVVETTALVGQVREISDSLQHFVDSFEAGNIKNFLPKWEKITTDKNILDNVRDGLKISFKDIPEPVNPSQQPFSLYEKEIIDSEVNKLLKRKVIVPTNIYEGDFVSAIFTRTKKDGSHRMILNLKKLNTFVDSPHFKMESIRSVISMVHKGVWTASVDLKDAFLLCQLMYMTKSTLNLFGIGLMHLQPCLMATLMLWVYSLKFLKPPFAVLRQSGHLSCVYADDSYLQGDTYSECQQTVHDTVALLLSLGFTIHPDKSVLKPTQVIIFLGFVINPLK